MPQAHQIRDTLVLKSTGPLRGGCADGEPQFHFLLPQRPGLCHLQPESGRSSGSGEGTRKSTVRGMPVSRPPSAFQTSRQASRWLWLPPFSSLGLSGLGGESCPVQPQPSPSRVWPTRYPGVGRQPASPSWRALRFFSAGDPPSRGLSGRLGALCASVRLWGYRGAPATGVIGIPAGLSRGGSN